MGEFMILNKIILIGLFMSLVVVGCAGDENSDGGDGGDNNNKPQNERYVNWESVPSEFNPSIDDIAFQTDGVEKINVDAFGFDQDVEVIYSSDMQANHGNLRIYKVFYEQASWGDLQPKVRGKNLNLINYGQYQCSIKVQNGQITSLEGGCYVRIQIFLPVGSELEVYNVDQLITKRFIPIDNEGFFDALDDASWDDEKFAVIDDYLASYTGSKKPSLTTYELGKVIQKFLRGEDKLKALSRLHHVVSDRQNLSSMIEKEFNHFDRQEARKIVGLF